MKAPEIIFHIARHTFADHVRQKSFLVIFIVCGFIVLGIRNCYQGSYTVNNQLVSAASFALGASKAMFNIVGTVAMILAALFSMRIINRERGDGTQSTILSKPVSRHDYVIGKAAGIWLVAFLFMFALHAVIFIITLVKTGEAMPGFLLASLLCSIGLLFVVCFVMLLSLYLPDFACFLIVSAIGMFGYIGDGIYSISRSRMAQDAFAQNAAQFPDISMWKIAYLALPKLSSAQLFASSLIAGEPFEYAGPVHPMINLALYCAAAVVLLLVLFRKQDVA